MQIDLACRPLGVLTGTSRMSAFRWKRGLIRPGSELDKKFCNAVKKLERERDQQRRNQRQLENLAVVGRRALGSNNEN